MRQVFLLLILLSQMMCFAQEIENEIDIKTVEVLDSVSKNPSIFNVSDSIHVADGHFSRLFIDKPLPIFEVPAPFESISITKNIVQPGTAVIPLWKNAQFIATGDMQVMPGLMKIDSGTIGINQNIGNYSLYIGAVANKYGYFNGLHTQYGVSGKLQYQISPKISLTAFGTYYFGNPKGFPMLPSMIGYYRVSNFGGYMSYQFNETFGVDVGAQTVRQFGTNRYRFEPIVTPNVKVGKLKIGLPVGQILYDVIRSHAEQRHYRK